MDNSERTWRGHGFPMVESRYKNKVFVKGALTRIWTDIHFFAYVYRNIKNSMLNPNMKLSKIGIQWSGTRKCSLRHEINHSCEGCFSAIQPSEMSSSNSIRSDPFQSNPMQSNPIDSNAIQSKQSTHQSIKSNNIKLNQIKSNQSAQ